MVFFGLGMVARDGLWLLLGTALLGGAFWLAMHADFLSFFALFFRAKCGIKTATFPPLNPYIGG